MDYKDLKKLMVVKVDEGQLSWNVLVLPVTKKDIKRGINADVPGLYGFRGLWYKGHLESIKPYGKIYDLKLYDSDELTLVRTNIIGLNRKQLNQLLDNPIKSN